MSKFAAPCGKCGEFFDSRMMYFISERYGYKCSPCLELFSVRDAATSHKLAHDEWPDYLTPNPCIELSNN